MIWGCVAITALVWAWYAVFVQGKREYEEWLAIHYGHLPPERRVAALLRDRKRDRDSRR